MSRYSGMFLLAHFICQPEDTLSAECNLQPDMHPFRSAATGCLKGVFWFCIAMGLGAAMSLLK